MSYFFYNGYYSYEMGLIVEEKSIYIGPQPDFELISVPAVGTAVMLNIENSYKYRSEDNMSWPMSCW